MASQAKKAARPNPPEVAPEAPTFTDRTEAVGSASPPQSSWKEFKDTDPLYAFLGELGENKIYNEDGTLNEERLDYYIYGLFNPGVIKKPKDWVEIWAAMLVPVDNQTPVIRRIMEVGYDSESSETFGEVLAELIKGHRVKLKFVEEALQDVFEYSVDEKGVLSKYFLYIFPKSPTSEFGWSRVGWNWQSWWDSVLRILNLLDPPNAFYILRELLTSMESLSGAFLSHQMVWDDKRLALVRGALCKFGEMPEENLGQVIDVSLGIE